ncbi:UNVERIFIED_CONTAM: hypothetical protein K2H54_068786 [Gekko kuhli]
MATARVRSTTAALDVSIARCMASRSSRSSSKPAQPALMPPLFRPLGCPTLFCGLVSKPVGDALDGGHPSPSDSDECGPLASCEVSCESSGNSSGVLYCDTGIRPRELVSAVSGWVLVDGRAPWGYRGSSGPCCRLGCCVGRGRAWEV